MDDRTTLRLITPILLYSNNLCYDPPQLRSAGIWFVSYTAMMRTF
jgi:hypothetical protein